MPSMAVIQSFTASLPKLPSPTVNFPIAASSMDASPARRRNSAAALIPSTISTKRPIRRAAHKDPHGDNLIIDVVRATMPPFDPQEVTKQYAELCREYRVARIYGDHYGEQWVQGAWMKHGITYLTSPLPKSKIYLETLPLFTRGLVRIPDHPTLIRELRLLERQTHRSGRDEVNHPKNGHDDAANVCCGVLRQLSDYKGYSLYNFEKSDNPNNAPRSWSPGMRLQQYIRANMPVGMSGDRVIDWSRM
jgi:hypothetical protein